jgi:hypothetical protein
MRDGILATFSVKTATEEEWAAFEKKWGVAEDSVTRSFPSNEEIFEREQIGLERRASVEDDWLPVVYSILDAGESMVGGMFGKPMRFIHRRRGPAFSKAETVMPDYSVMPTFSEDNEWRRRFLSIQEYFEKHSGDRFAQHPCLTMDALNFVVEMREATTAYTDLYEHPDELKALMEVGLEWSINFQEAQRERIAPYADGCFEWLAGWVPFPEAVSLSVDAYVICGVPHYAEFGFDYQRRLIEHFGHGFMHFHCNRTDLAAEVAKLPGLELFQFGGDTRDPLPPIDRLPDMRKVVGDVPIMISCEEGPFLSRLNAGTLMPNVWYCVGRKNEQFTADEANRAMDQVRAYQA